MSVISEMGEGVRMLSNEAGVISGESRQVFLTNQHDWCTAGDCGITGNTGSGTCAAVSPGM